MSGDGAELALNPGAVRPGGHDRGRGHRDVVLERQVGAVHHNRRVARLEGGPHLGQVTGVVEVHPNADPGEVGGQKGLRTKLGQP